MATALAMVITPVMAYNSAKGKIDDNGIGNSNVRECG